MNIRNLADTNFYRLQLTVFGIDLGCLANLFQMLLILVANPHRPKYTLKLFNYFASLRFASQDNPEQITAKKVYSQNINFIGAWGDFCRH